ncbi:histidinol dehydrogenase [Nitrospira sp. M1]
MKIISHQDQTFSRLIQGVIHRSAQQNERVETSVKGILQAIKKGGDAAIVRYVKQFDQLSLQPKQFHVTRKEIQKAHAQIGKEEEESLRFAANRIREFHECQRTSTWTYNKGGVRLGQLVTPLDAVGVYVPGGKALYPSSVMMNAIPAKVAGVKRIVMCTPTSTGEIHPYLLVAAAIAGVDEIYRVGGVQAIGGMAFGTKTIQPVDKIVGPGNLYVATAKRLVYGQVDIDMVAGPSELLVIADGTSNPAHVAADLLCEAEHDEEARVYLVTTSKKLAQNVVAMIDQQLASLGRRKIATTSIRKYAFAFVVPSLAKAFALSNQIAPEHLSVNLDRPDAYLPHIRHAGAIFLGRYTPPAVADYVAGPNHVLPTGGSARFFSSLSLDDYVKKSNLVTYSRKELKAVHKHVVRLSHMEGLDAHGKSMESRWL